MNLFTPAKIAALLADMKAENTAAYDLRRIPSIADYVLITEGVSPPHIRAMAEKLYRSMKTSGLSPKYDGRSSAFPDWAVIDSGRCVVHIMLAEKRDFYALDRLFDNGRKMKC